MAYQRKTEDEYELIYDYGCGKEVISRCSTYREAKRTKRRTSRTKAFVLQSSTVVSRRRTEGNDMANLLKRNGFGGIDRVCNHPDRDGNKVLTGQCYGCTHRITCNAEIIDRLAKYEESGLEPDSVKRIASQNTVVEVCPECDAENEIAWDVETMGYEAHCPVCGVRMLLCDECMHADDKLNEDGRNCDWHMNENGRNVCFRCKKK